MVVESLCVCVGCAWSVMIYFGMVGFMQVGLVSSPACVRWIDLVYSSALFSIGDPARHTEITEMMRSPSRMYTLLTPSACGGWGT